MISFQILGRANEHVKKFCLKLFQVKKGAYQLYVSQSFFKILSLLEDTCKNS